MFSKILIANRGEIACRIIRTCRALGVTTVAVYSDADSKAQHVRLADEAVHLGPAPARESYLRADAVIEAAVRTGAQAIHPGYGFLSENPDFARACAKAGLVFIGPPAEAIDAMGSKSAAKRIMEKAGVPLVPGYHGADQDMANLRETASEIGYPVMLKAVHGGGGKGMRVVDDPAEFDAAAAAARREGENAFGNGDLLVEKCVVQPRHVEIQVFADTHGNAVYLAERDCSVQRRHQKVIEEAPAPGMTPELRRAMGEAAVRAAQAINYVGAGTVEFLLDRDGSFYFMEMNTRLQVEHPVTEMITGQDLVDWQLRVAVGEALPLKQVDIELTGHAVEARIYAEDPEHDFLPATGTLTCLRTPQTNDRVRIDTGVVEGDEVSIYYDPMIAKLVVHGRTRTEALRLMTRALADYRIDGVVTNIPFLRRLAGHPAFGAAELDTGFIERHHEALLAPAPLDVNDMSALAAALHVELLRRKQAVSADPWDQLAGWRLNRPAYAAVEVEHQGDVVRCVRTDMPAWPQVLELTEDRATLAWQGRQYHYGWSARGDTPRHLTLFVDGRPWRCVCQPAEEHVGTGKDVEHSLTAPMNGTVVSILVDKGQDVKAGQALLVMEAMKMEHTIRAPADGTVEEIWFQVGGTVTSGSELLAFVPAEESVE
ncbi:MAG: acetyl/propionyl/methylcrotonyl-CoA carboxylase subunit alpha [Natronospirillum sp.]|uniref:acetyl/propionyl/methylcrotonyl-CoA carboxylase subunit alpha n=1 Tax=Natronospirillum sp. TaxID=2812955 RepID=UPI0025D859C6|nr:acetyl/propionyl/methylcrotonyl-CoA carboxylase subunit alpha [Natronospirillum sp.]MCH8551530.1 acetyl/propionyl/methylcrotonyl-CoA carboxylase subunit alpha [Natronospirillum sp.]